MPDACSAAVQEMQHQLDRSHARLRQLESAVHEAESNGAKNLAAARCNRDALHEEEAQELRVSKQCLPPCLHASGWLLSCLCPCLVSWETHTANRQGLEKWNRSPGWVYKKTQLLLCCAGGEGVL